MTDAEIRAIRERVAEATRQRSNQMAKKTRPMPKPKGKGGKQKGC